MSYTTIYKVPKQGELEVIAELNNAWRGAPFIWTRLGERYLEEAQKNPYWTPFTNPQAIWDLAKDDRLHNEEKITLRSTFDYVMVKRENIHRVCWAFSQFAQWYQEMGDHSLMEQWGILNKATSDPSIFAVCWRQTSVTDMWSVPERDDYRLYDISRDSGHWFLFGD